MIQRALLTTTTLLALSVFVAPPATGNVATDEQTVTTSGESLELSDYISMALERSPQIAAARSRYTASAARASRAGGLPEPVLSYGHFFREVETRVGPQTQRYGLRQQIPMFGKLSLRRHAAEERAAAEQERLRAVELAVASQVTRAYADCAYVSIAIGIANERLALVSSLERVIRTMYASGGASYSDVMSAQIRVARLEDEVASFVDSQSAALARLSAAVGLAPGAVTVCPTTIPDVRLTPELGSGSLEAIAAAPEALASNPELGALEHEVEAARLERAIAGRGYLPDLNVGFDYIVTDEAAMDVEDSGKDPFIGVVSMNVPLWMGQNRSRVKEADAALNAALEMRQQRTNALAAELVTALSRTRDLRRKEALYDERLIPAANQSVAADEASYRAGEADFDAVMRAHDTALDFELSYARARADLLASVADVERLIGARGSSQ